MHWSAEEFVLVITSALFVVAVASSYLARVELTPAARATFAIGAVTFLGAAVLLARLEEVLFPWILWAMPAVPVVAFLVARGRAPQPTSAPAGVPAPVVRRASAFADDPERDAQASTARSVLRARAQDPRASARELAQLACLHAHLRPVIAANPATPAGVLEWLASHRDPAIDVAISSRRASAARPSPVG